MASRPRFLARPVSTVPARCPLALYYYERVVRERARERSTCRTSAQPYEPTVSPEEKDKQRPGAPSPPLFPPAAQRASARRELFPNEAAGREPFQVRHLGGPREGGGGWVGLGCASGLAGLVSASPDEGANLAAWPAGCGKSPFRGVPCGWEEPGGTRIVARPGPAAQVRTWTVVQLFPQGWPGGLGVVMMGWFGVVPGPGDA